MVFSEDPSAGLDCTNHLSQGLRALGEPLQQQARVDQAERRFVDRIRDDIVFTHLKIGMLQLVQEARVQVGRHTAPEGPT
jgi:hypothetical protein